MRSSCGLCLAFISLTGCGSHGSSSTSDGGGSDSGIDAPRRGFQIRGASVVVEPNQEFTYCHYFRTPNTEPMAIHTWRSSMTSGSHHMIMFTSAQDMGTPGTYTPNCGFGSSLGRANRAVWTYAAHSLHSMVALPTDDGEGRPLGQVVQPNTPGFLQVHYLNPTAAPLTVEVVLDAEAFDANAAFTETAPYITYHAGLSINPTGVGGTPSLANGGIATQTCTTPPDAKFWMISTHAHKQAVKTEVRNGPATSATVVFTSEDWENPIPRMWNTPPFYTFNDASGPNKLTYTCTYVNNTNRIITSGDSEQTDEMCMAIGFMFPAAQPTHCLCATLGCFNT